ncbi:MAG: hypothetical protein K6G00_05860 [Treponema sp.]|nr:hypothetical protein [Treponema sp.]
MTRWLNENRITPSRNWILLLKSVEMRQQHRVKSQYCNLYDYASNNPVKCTDPDGNDVTDNTNDCIVLRREDPVCIIS